MQCNKVKIIEQYKIFSKQIDKKIKSDKKIVITMSNINKHNTINCTA